MARALGRLGLGPGLALVEQGQEVPESLGGVAPYPLTPWARRATAMAASRDESGRVRAQMVLANNSRTISDPAIGVQAFDVPGS